MTRRVLITGAGGFVGSHLAQGFAAMGDTVIGVDLSFDHLTRRRLDGVRLIERDLLAVDGSTLPAADLVIHGSAITTPQQSADDGDDAHLDANVALLRTSLDHAVACKASEFVFLSSSGVFTTDDGRDVHLESTTPTATLPYARAKRAGEAAVAAARGLMAISVRLGPIYGPYEAPRQTRTIVSPVRRWLDMAKAGQPILVELPEERRDWTYAPDLAGALNALLQDDLAPGSIYHLTSGQIFSNGEIARMIADLVAGSSIADARVDRQTRLPMSSDRLYLAELYDWTPMRQGLAQLIDCGGRA